MVPHMETYDMVVAHSLNNHRTIMALESSLRIAIYSNLT